jgi:hypothetical protein
MTNRTQDPDTAGTEARSTAAFDGLNYIRNSVVLDGVLVPRDHRGRQIGQGWIGRFLDLIQLEGLPSEVDVIFQVGRLQRQLARLHNEFLKGEGTSVCVACNLRRGAEKQVKLVVLP